MRFDRTTAILIVAVATFGLDVFSTFTSSPQTTELNAKSRSTTLMKWVYIGAAVALGGGVVASLADGSLIPLAVTLVVAVSMVLLYRHARDSGLGSDEPGTESY